jgi:5-formyltetrahydrofolate cyclo-ligase
MHITEQKSQLRAALLERLKRMSEKDRTAESRSLCKRILEALPPGPITITGYVPLRTEPDIRPLLEELLKRGDSVFLPRFENGKLAFRQVFDLDHLAPGELKIMEPPASAPLLDPQKLDICIVPARGFDAKGWRLGRGNGGYDIWIKKQRTENPKSQFWGIALECQIVPDVPREEHDERVDAVVTARGKMTVDN